MRIALLLALACLAGCVDLSKGPVDCNDESGKKAAIAYVIQCMNDYCNSDPGQACTCIRSGLYFEPTSCGCTTSLADSVEHSICTDGYAIGTDENCQITQANLAIAITGTGCGSCNHDSECERGTLCTAGQCKPGCHVDSDCDQGKICTGSSCLTGCRSELNCDFWQSCQEGICAGKPCTDPRDCYPDHVCSGGTCK